MDKDLTELIKTIFDIVPGYYDKRKALKIAEAINNYLMRRASKTS